MAPWELQEWGNKNKIKKPLHLNFNRTQGKTWDLIQNITQLLCYTRLTSCNRMNKNTPAPTFWNILPWGGERNGTECRMRRGDELDAFKLCVSHPAKAGLWHKSPSASEINNLSLVGWSLQAPFCRLAERTNIRVNADWQYCESSKATGWDRASQVPWVLCWQPGHLQQIAHVSVWGVTHFCNCKLECLPEARVTLWQQKEKSSRKLVKEFNTGVRAKMPKQQNIHFRALWNQRPEMSCYQGHRICLL